MVFDNLWKKAACKIYLVPVFFLAVILENYVFSYKTS